MHKICMMLYIGKVYIDMISELANGMGCNAGLASVFVDGCIPVDLQTIIPYGRWDIEEAFSPTPLVNRMTMYTRFGAFISAVEHFDAQAFSMPRNEAIAMDPQQRLLLEEVGSAWRFANDSTIQALSKYAGKLEVNV